MFRYGFAAFLVLACASVGSHPQTSAQSAPVTFNKDVLPILQKNCQTCHRPGQMAPMSLMTFREARPWARAMKSKVESRQMPPWFADPAHGEFANDRSLPTRDIETIAKWADNGALEGDPKDAPPPCDWPADGWQIKPDIVVRGPEFRVPARTPNDVVEWVTFLIPSGFTKDTWITSLEIKPSELAVTHHICFTFEPHRPNAKYYVANWSESPRDDEGAAIRNTNTTPPAPASWRAAHPVVPRRAEQRRRIPAAASIAGCPGAPPTTIVRSARANWFPRAAIFRSRSTTRRTARKSSIGR